MTYQPLNVKILPTESHREWFLKVLDYANAAPSIMHTKPWLYRMVADQLSVYRDRSKHISGFDENLHFMTVNAGLLLYYITITMKYFGLNPEVKTFPDLENPDLLADIRIKNEITPDDAIIEQFNVLRHPWRLVNNPDFDKANSKEFACQLKESIASDWITYCCECDSKDLAKIKKESSWNIDDIIAASPAEELKNNSDIIYPEALLDYRPYYTDALSHILLHTPQDNSMAWLQAGIELGQLQLKLKSHGLVGLVVPWKLEQPELQEKLSCIRDNNAYPQVIVRVYPAEKLGDLTTSPVQNLMYFRG